MRGPFRVTETIRWRTLAAFAAALLLAQAAAAQRILEGRVVRVFDGDTIEVLIEGETVRVRLAGIDTPERGQPWATQAKKALSGRVFGKEVRVNEVATDRYGRTVGEVYADNVCVGCELVRDGHAWVYRHYSDDPVLIELEAQARAAERGLWSLPESERVPPWEWRRAQSSRTRKARPAGEGAEADFRCGTKTRCREMTGCAEARFHLESCGLTSIDGDGDGMPCESLCRGDRPGVRSGTE
jgi:endonuclease YncB( thermonuclease family)